VTIALNFSSLRALSRDQMKQVLKAQFNWSDRELAEFDDPYQSEEEMIEYLLDPDADKPEDTNGLEADSNVQPTHVRSADTEAEEEDDYSDLQVKPILNVSLILIPRRLKYDDS
jgi:hypothetical protein